MAATLIASLYDQHSLAQGTLCMLQQITSTCSKHLMRGTVFLDQNPCKLKSLSSTYSNLILKLHTIIRNSVSIQAQSHDSERADIPSLETLYLEHVISESSICSRKRLILSLETNLSRKVLPTGINSDYQKFCSGVPHLIRQFLPRNFVPNAQSFSCPDDTLPIGYSAAPACLGLTQLQVCHLSLNNMSLFT